MHSSQSSNSVFKKRAFWYSVITWLSRLLVGGTFAYSGFVKAIDVWGTLYKFDEYLSVLGIPLFHNLVLLGVFLLCAVEFMTGVFLLLGCYRKSTPVIALLMMCVMLPLALWIAISNPVADCGCFGDAWVISNWATFWKNILLSALIVWLVKHNRQIPCIITPAFQWIGLLASAAYVVVIGMYGYMIQPMIDFRPFGIGTSLIADDTEYDGPTYAFTYEKDGVRQEFTEDNLPSEEEGWTFVSRRELQAGNYSDNRKNDHSFHLMDKHGTEDVTEDVLTDEGAQLMLLIPSLRDISASTTYKINLLNEWSRSHNISMSAVIAPNSGDMAEWEDLSMPSYPIYTTDDTAIKELARGNPAVVYIKDGIIRWKTTLMSINEDLFADPDTQLDIDSLAPDRAGWLKKISLTYAGVLLLLIAISFVPRLARLFKPLASKTLSRQDFRDKRRKMLDERHKHRTAPGNDDSDANRGDTAHPVE